MSTYEVHIPSGKRVTIVCNEDEEMKVLKNGTTVYSEGSAAPGNTGSTNAPGSTEETQEEETSDAENNSNATVENNMAGGKKSRRNNMRKNNVTRRKNQAGGKRGPNGYMKFANKIRPQVLKEHPELKSDVVGVARKIGEKWRSLSAAEKAKY